jgi:hypothetical protein
MEGMLVPEWMLPDRTAPGRTGFWQFPCIPGFAKFFPGSGGKIPGSALTGIPVEVIDTKTEIYAIQHRGAANLRISRLVSRFTGIWPLIPEGVTCW